jgi:hypothetical protein
MFGAIIKPLGYRKKPTLWYEGLTGRGKTSLVEILQQFYGAFPVTQNWLGTSKGMLDYCHRFKDTVMVIDDFKHLDRHQIKAAEETVQYGYDGGSRSALTKTGTQRGDKSSRCLLVTSGEDTPTGEASVISRMLLIPYPKTDVTTTATKFDKCDLMREQYCGITPLFIHYFLQQDLAVVKAEIKSLYSELLGPVRDKGNAPRIAQHFAYNFVVWKMFVHFMLDVGAIDVEESTKLIEEHRGYTKHYRDLMIARCASEAQGLLFTEALKEILHTKRASIVGLAGYDSQFIPEIGFVRENDEDTDAVYIHPGIAISMVKKEMTHLFIKVTPRNIAEQMIAEGVITEFDTNKQTKMITAPVGSGHCRPRVWVMSLSKLGFESRKPRVVKKAPPPLPQPMMEGGLI